MDDTTLMLQTLIVKNMHLSQDNQNILSEQAEILKGCYKYEKVYAAKKLELEDLRKKDEEYTEIINCIKQLIDECQQKIKDLQLNNNILTKKIQNIKIVNIHNRELSQNDKNVAGIKNIKYDLIKNLSKLHISNKSSINHVIGFYQTTSDKEIKPFNYTINNEDTDIFWKHFSDKNKSIESLRMILNKKNSIDSTSVITINETITSPL